MKHYVRKDCTFKSNARKNYADKRILILFLLFSFLSINSLLGQNVKIAGSVYNKEKTPIPYCNVVLKTNNDSTFVKGSVTNEKGYFSLELPKGDYILHVSYIGYEEYKQPVNIKENITFAPISLTESAITLNEINISGKRKVFKADADIYYLANSTKTMGRNALEVISLASGVTISGQEGIKIYGKGGVRVSINGRMLQMTGDDLKSYLANIRGEDIASMEVIKSANAAYDADATAGIIKIKLKSRESNGYDAAVGLLTATDFSSYIGINPDFSINSRVGKFNIYGNLSYDGVGSPHQYYENSHYKGQNSAISTETLLKLKDTKNLYFARFGTIYQINDAHSIGIDMDMTNHREKNNYFTTSTITNSGKSTDYDVVYYAPDSIQKYNASFNYIWKIDKAGSQLKFGTDYYYQKDDTKSDNTMTCIQDKTYLEKSFGLITYNRRMFTTGLDFTWAYSPSLTFDIGAKYNNTRMHDYLDYSYKNGFNGSWVKDTESTDHMKYKEIITAGYINSEYHKANWTINAGVRYEQTKRDNTSKNFADKDVHQTNNDFFPMVTATYDIDKEKGHQLTFKYSSGITRPSFGDLVPYSSQQNLYSYVEGNPDLKPTYSYNAGIDLLLFRGFYLGTSFTREKDKVETTILPKDNEGLIMIGKPENIKRLDSYAITANIPLPISKNILFDFTLMGSKKERTLNDGTKDKLNQFYGEFTTDIKLTDNLSFDSKLMYINKEFHGNMLLKNYYTFDFGIRQTLLKKKLQIAFNATNAFGKKSKLYIDDKYITRLVIMKSAGSCSLFTLSVRYLFNSKTKVKENRVKAFNVEERER